MRVRLRADPTPEEMDQLYPARYDHRRWTAHVERVGQMVAMGRRMLPQGGMLADLSCGDGAVVAGIGGGGILGDYVPGWCIRGPIEKTLWEIEPGSVDLWVLGETLEHVADPDWLLAAVRERAARLLLSTPIGETDRNNPEHVWGWDCADVRAMLEEAGWAPVEHEVMERPGGQTVYSFQLWGCE